jgi:alkane 1-monooxygenase
VARGTLVGGRISDAATSTGLNSGISGIVVAHELIHRRKKAWRLAGIWNLLLVNYGHFYVEHLRVHHRLVGTVQDPGTARRGESVYVFILRSIAQQFFAALRVEAKRLGKAGHCRYGLGNFVVLCVLLQACLGLFLYLALGSKGLTAHLRQSAVAVLVNYLVGYLQHYGLARTPPTKITAAHSWQSDRISSRLIFLELPRHSDHHTRASRPYHQLESHEESPVLPAGYLGTLPLLLIPPLWFRIADRRIRSPRPTAPQTARQDVTAAPGFVG